MPLTLPMRNKWLNHCFGNGAMTPPTEWWVQLHYGDPGVNGTDNAWIAAGRRQLNFTAASNRQNQNGYGVVWSTLPDPGANNYVTAVSIWSHATSTDTALHSISYGTLSSPRLVVAGGTISIYSGDIRNIVA